MGGSQMTYSRYTGLDLHKQFIQATTLDSDGRILKQWRFATAPEAIREFAQTLTEEDAVASSPRPTRCPSRSFCGSMRASSSSATR